MQSFKFVADETTDAGFWGEFVTNAKKYSSTVTVTIGGKTASGKQIMNVIALGSGEATIKVEGSDEYACAVALIPVVENYGIKFYDAQIAEPQTDTNYTLTLPDGITASGDNVTSTGTNSYSCRAGITVTLNIGKGVAIGNVSGISNAEANTDGNISFNIGSNVTITDENLYYRVFTSGLSGTFNNGQVIYVENSACYRSFSVSDYAGGTISFANAITSLTTDGNQFIAKVGDKTAITFTVSIAATGGNIWQVSGTSASYIEKSAGNAAIDGKKIVYQASNDSQTLFTLENLKSTVNTSDLADCINVTGSNIIVKAGYIFDTGKKNNRSERLHA